MTENGEYIVDFDKLENTGSNAGGVVGNDVDERTISAYDGMSGDASGESSAADDAPASADVSGSDDASTDVKNTGATAETPDTGKEPVDAGKAETNGHSRATSKLRMMLANKKFEEALERKATEEPDESSPFSLAQLLGGVMLTRFVQKQIGVVLLIGFFLLIYISTRYMCQKTMLEIASTEAKIEHMRYKATVCTSKLTETSRESNVLKRLSECGDSTLTIADEPPYLIKIENE